MRDRLLIVTLSVLALQSGAAADERALRKALTPMYAKIEAAFRKRDVAAFMALTAPNFTGKQKDKVVEGSKVQMQLGMEFAMLQSMDKVTMKMEKVTSKDGKAVVVNRYSFAGTVAPEKGKILKMADNGVTRDTWVKTPKGWLLLQLETVKSNPTFNGRPVSEYMGGKSSASKPK